MKVTKAYNGINTSFTKLSNNIDKWYVTDITIHDYIDMYKNVQDMKERLFAFEELSKHQINIELASNPITNMLEYLNMFAGYYKLKIKQVELKVEECYLIELEKRAGKFYDYSTYELTPSKNNYSGFIGDIENEVYLIIQRIRHSEHYVTEDCFYRIVFLKKCIKLLQYIHSTILFNNENENIMKRSCIHLLKKIREDKVKSYASDICFSFMIKTLPGIIRQIIPYNNDTSSLYKSLRTLENLGEKIIHELSEPTISIKNNTTSEHIKYIKWMNSHVTSNIDEILTELK